MTSRKEMAGRKNLGKSIYFAGIFESIWAAMHLLVTFLHFGHPKSGKYFF